MVNETQNGKGSSLRERETFAAIYEANRDRVRAVLFRIVVTKASAETLDDLVQQTFVKIWRSYAQFRNEASASTWIYRIAINTALDYLRKYERTPESPVSNLIAVAQGEGDEKAISDRDLIEKGLAALSDEHRTVLVLAFLHDLPIAEVATIAGTNEGTVKSRLHYAKIAFRDYLSRNGVTL